MKIQILQNIGYKKHLKDVTVPILVNPAPISKYNPKINKNQKSLDKNWKYLLYFLYLSYS